MKLELKVEKSKKDNLWYWEIKTNDKTLAVCQMGYKTKAECEQNLAILKHALAYFERVKNVNASCQD